MAEPPQRRAPVATPRVAAARLPEPTLTVVPTAGASTASASPVVSPRALVATPESASTPNAIAAVAAPTPRTGGALSTVGGLLSGKLFSPERAQRTVIVIAPTERNVLWRLGARGKLEHSKDSGKSWEISWSGVTVDLLAGAARSESVCWVVGREGTILRTIDGEHWDKIPPPTNRDLTGISVHGSSSVAITADNGESFTTTNDGRTWQRFARQGFAGAAP